MALAGVRDRDDRAGDVLAAPSYDSGYVWSTLLYWRSARDRVPVAREDHAERAALAGGALDADLAAGLLDDAVRRGEAQARALRLGGDNRISAIIRYLTQSSWSHAALYVGDELLRRGGPRAEEARQHFGKDADALLVEALPDGVVTSPLSKYVDFNIRLVRPHG